MLMKRQRKWKNQQKFSVLANLTPKNEKVKRKENSEGCTLCIKILIRACEKKEKREDSKWTEGEELKDTGFPCGSAGKEPACNVGDLGSIPGLGRSPGEGKGYPLQYAGLENSWTV